MLREWVTNIRTTETYVGAGDCLLLFFLATNGELGTSISWRRKRKEVMDVSRKTCYELMDECYAEAVRKVQEDR